MAGQIPVFNGDLAMSSNTMDHSTTITSAVVHLLTGARCSIQLAWTGTPTGNFTVQLSNDESSAPTTWTTMTGSTQAAGGAAGNHIYDIETGARRARISYTSTGSTGTITLCRATVKG